MISSVEIYIFLIQDFTAERTTHTFVLLRSLDLVSLSSPTRPLCLSLRLLWPLFLGPSPGRVFFCSSTRPADPSLHHPFVGAALPRAAIPLIFPSLGRPSPGRPFVEPSITRSGSSLPWVFSSPVRLLSGGPSHWCALRWVAPSAGGPRWVPNPTLCCPGHPSRHLSSLGTPFGKPSRSCHRLSPRHSLEGHLPLVFSPRRVVRRVSFLRPD